MLKTASACLRYESIESLQTLVGQIAEAEVLAASTRDKLQRGRIDRAGTLAAMGLAVDYLREFRQMAIGFAAACAAEEASETDEQRPPVKTSNIVPFPGRNRPTGKNVSFARKY